MVEFLVWLPGLKLFATLFLSSKTARREAPNLKSLLMKPATLKVNLIKKGKYSWHGPVVVPCSTPMSNLPHTEEVLEQAEKFANPKTSEVETVEEPVSTRER